MINILLVEDEPLWQQGIQALLQTHENLYLAGIAEDGDYALELFGTLKPDIVLMDWNLKAGKSRMDGLDVAKAMTDQGYPTGRIILVTGSDPALLPAHTHVVVSKPKIASHLIEAIMNVAI
ncbi:MAG: response regulator transcription factor [Vampirovibrio sp.]|nr:response regulator transcription factor [Vampirovibrio sp.]